MVAFVYLSSFISNPSLLTAGKAATVASIGLFAGVSLSYNAIIMPSLRKISNESALPVWASAYNIGKKLQVGLILTSIVAGSSVYYKTENPYFLAAPLIMGSIVPYTLALIMPTNKILLGILDGAKSDAHLDELFVKWDLLHFGRTVMSMVALGLTLYGSFSSRTFIVRH
ncbi:hypothetical protein BGZ98_010068 [Dissophora globulifera]|nr:hypothetical protein BGZ98_010068 [Dissophora globulifera]